MRQQCRRRPRVTPLIVFALMTLWLCGGCALYVKNVCDMNRSLTYVGWSADSSCACKPLEGTPAEREIRVLPGMRLTFHTTPLRPIEKRNNGQLVDEGQNAVTPPISKYEWIVPRERFTPDDYFVIGYLLATSFREDVNDIDALQTIGNGLDASGFYTSLNQELYAKIVASLRYAPGSRPAEPLCSETSRLRQSLAEPTKEDFLGPLSPPQLVFTLNDTLFTFGQSPAAYFNRDAPTTSGPPPSPWFQSGSARGRVLVTVDVPVRILSEPVSRYVPIHTSVADLEKRLGVEVKGIRRSRDFFKEIVVEGLLWGAKREDVISDDGYFTIWFDRWGGWARHDSKHSLLVKNARETALLAPGDVVVLRTNRREKATDDPVVH